MFRGALFEGSSLRCALHPIGTPYRSRLALRQVPRNPNEHLYKKLENW